MLTTEQNYKEKPKDLYSFGNNRSELEVFSKFVQCYSFPKVHETVRTVFQECVATVGCNYKRYIK